MAKSASKGETRETRVVCRGSQAGELHATLLRLTRYLAILEFHGPALALRTSEVFREMEVIAQERTIYSGRAVVSNLVSTGMKTVCEVALTEGAWRDVEFTVEMLRSGKLREQFRSFLREWQKHYRVVPEYKVIVADMQTYLSDLQLWLDQVELGIRSTPSADCPRLEQDAAEELAEPVIPCVNALFERFEAVAQRLDDESLPAHCSYMRRQLHPLVLCAPFAHRTFQKPLGYAGDYEMVNMIVRNQHEGASLYAKVVNTWFLRQPPAQAHRNRVDYLADTLIRETLRLRREGRNSRIFNVACGPAQEVQRFLGQSPLSDHARLTLLDFNEETLAHARSVLRAAQERHSRQTRIEYVKRSVQQILKESGRPTLPPGGPYDVVYCAGLFDYLSDQICQRLVSILYDWMTGGGLLVVTNVEPSNPLRNGMEHLLDWHLIYRTAAQMRALLPACVPAEECSIRSDHTGLNLFLEVRKHGHA